MEKLFVVSLTHSPGLRSVPVKIPHLRCSSPSVRRTFGRRFDADRENRLFIPYTDQVLDLNLNGGWANRILLQVYKDWGAHQVTQKWIIDSSMYS
jgi:hypothetical protein